MSALDVIGHAYMKHVHIGQLKDFIAMSAIKKTSYTGGMDSNFALTV